MKKIMMFGFIGLFFGLNCFAQDGTIPSDQFLMFLIQSIGGIKGASTLAIVGVAVQVIVMFLKSEICNQIFKNFSGFGKLITISVLTLIGGVVSLMVSSGMGIVPALIHSSTLTALMVLINQLSQQFKKV